MAALKKYIADLDLSTLPAELLILRKTLANEEVCHFEEMKNDRIEQIKTKPHRKPNRTDKTSLR